HDPRDAVSIEPLVSDWLAVCENIDLRGLRVAWSPDFGYAAVDSEVLRLATAAARGFADLGCNLEEGTPPWQGPTGRAAALWDFQTAIRNHERAQQHPEWIEPTMQAQIDRGLRVTALDVGEAQLARTAFYEQARAFLQDYDLLLTPQMPCVAWPVFDPPTQIGGRPLPNLFDP